RQYETQNDVKLKFEVEDTGIGITESEKNKIFMPFRQLHSTNVGHPSSGLGLSISRHLVEMMEGKMWVESKYGIGSTFHFTVKLKKNLWKPFKRELNHHLGHLNILVVDDN